MASMGKVLFPKNAAWKGDVLSQMIRFPAGKHDDSVDVMSLIGRGLEYIRTPSNTKPRVKQGYSAGWMG